MRFHLCLEDLCYQWKFWLQTTESTLAGFIREVIYERGLQQRENGLGSKAPYPGHALLPWRPFLPLLVHEHRCLSLSTRHYFKVFCFWCLWKLDVCSCLCQNGIHKATTVSCPLCLLGRVHVTCLYPRWQGKLGKQVAAFYPKDEWNHEMGSSANIGKVSKGIG